jgi:LmbE family N-acetylglucosaminyl deacetylase
MKFQKDIFSNAMVIAPHPDDETLGCGGSLARFIDEGVQAHWLIVTKMTTAGYSKRQIQARDKEIKQVSSFFRFVSVTNLGFPVSSLGDHVQSLLVDSISESLSQVKPDLLFVPFPGDAHSDHGAVFRAAMAASKWFRGSSAKRILCYETLSETGWGLDPTQSTFQPNVFLNVEHYLDFKISAMKMYKSEIGPHPFPRSERSVRALADLRGSLCGCDAAEGFMLIKEVR